MGWTKQGLLDDQNATLEKYWIDSVHVLASVFWFKYLNF